MISKKDRFIQRLEKLSIKYIKISFLLNNLGQSLKHKFKGQGNEKEFRKYVKEELNIDFDKVIKQSNFFKEFEFEDVERNK